MQFAEGSKEFVLCSHISATKGEINIFSTTKSVFVLVRFWEKKVQLTTFDPSKYVVLPNWQTGNPSSVRGSSRPQEELVGPSKSFSGDMLASAGCDKGTVGGVSISITLQTKLRNINSRKFILLAS